MKLKFGHKFTNAKSLFTRHHAPLQQHVYLMLKVHITRNNNTETGSSGYIHIYMFVFGKSTNVICSLQPIWESRLSFHCMAKWTMLYSRIENKVYVTKNCSSITMYNHTLQNKMSLTASSGSAVDYLGSDPHLFRLLLSSRWNYPV